MLLGVSRLTTNVLCAWIAMFRKTTFSGRIILKPKMVCDTPQYLPYVATINPLGCWNPVAKLFKKIALDATNELASW